MNVSTKNPETEQERSNRLKKVANATIIGSMLEWYDFYLYATMASVVFSKIFFDTKDPASASLQAFATFAIGFVARPFGGIFFGYFGDKFGRKKMLSFTFCLMGICTALIGLIPSYASIGIWAPILLVTIRVFQGLGTGAELAGAAVTAYEHAPQGKKGRQGAWPALGLNLGLLFSSLTVYLLTLNGNEFLLAGGWRIPFILSAALVLVGIWVRKSLPESPEYEQVTKKPSFKSTFKHLFKVNTKGLVIVFLFSIGYNALSYIFKTFSLAYLTQFKNMLPKETSLAVTLASVVAICTVPLFGWLCDRFSSKKILMMGGFLSVLFAYPFMYLLQTGEKNLVFIAIIVGTGVLAPMMFAPQGSFLSAQFDVATRSTGVGTAREIGTALSAGFIPLWALALVTQSPTHSIIGVVMILAFAGSVVFITAFFGVKSFHKGYFTHIPSIPLKSETH